MMRRIRQSPAKCGAAARNGAETVHDRGMTAAPRSPNEPASVVTTLRAWLDRLAARDRLSVVRPGVALRFELAAIVKHFEGRRAVLFPRPGGHGVPVVSGIVAARAWIAEAMGVAEAGLLARFEAASNAPLPCRRVAAAPAQEVVHERDIDLARLLPLPTHNELDSGPYITAGLVITRNPETGAQNVAILRCQLNGPARLGVLVLPRHTHHFLAMAEAKGEPLPVAIAIGVDPLTLLASQAIAPLDQDELEIAGALHGAPLPVAKCLGSDILVPAEAEFVLEGRFLPGVRDPEGPFGEFPQYYGSRDLRPVIEVDRVTQRRDAIFHTINGGGLEHLLLGAIPREATLLAHLKRSFPSVKDVHLPLGGTGRYHLYVQMRKAYEGEAKNVILGAFAGHYDLKQVIVVDEDVNIHDPQEVEWAVATRMQADRDLVVISGAHGSRLDPSADNGVGAKLGIDATIPLGSDPMRFKRIRIPGEEAVDLVASVDPRPAAQWRDRLG
jgi:2,5-furandicarboxylate decarboxylase 1